ncbi:MAG: conserved phage C-terminal domain-containing protein, partial [Candidatus Lokiarchaeota archaeon]|nr:conserved phage C-terminal domain-containing protein [Candidatus Lokiarchaeota archaeon]
TNHQTNHQLTTIQPPANHQLTTNKEGKEGKEGKDLIPYKGIMDYLNLKTNKKYKTTSAKTKEIISTRWKESFNLEDFIKVIDIKSVEWLNTDMEKFLRPETLFSNKFEGYLNQKSTVKKEVKKYQEFGSAY